MRFWNSCDKLQCKALWSLTSRAFEGYDDLLSPAERAEFISSCGRLVVFRTKEKSDVAHSAQRRRQERGIVVRRLTGDEAHEIEPGISPSIRYAYFNADGGYLRDPAGLVWAIVDAFRRNGGSVVADQATGLTSSEGRISHVDFSARSTAVNHVVIAAGAACAISHARWALRPRFRPNAAITSHSLPRPVTSASWSLHPMTEW
ncbi:MAG: FAD-binding oxidoreductase [Alphaproteobacteria bacterium]|nr:FAD-binding oxidoreductase [Alphaproteobacteria bacterium]